MCGITGVVNWGDSTILSAMNGSQTHRGPDDHGLFETYLPNDGFVGLGSRRLAILDLSPAGHMPMSNPEGTLHIAYNGEVYNYPQLRRELESKGYSFRSNSDTEAILYLYQEYGVDCVRRLNGMFAIAIWDHRDHSLFLARDHFGIKPLYYCQQDHRFAFASEIKALLLLPGIARTINSAALTQYLTFLWVPDPLTMFGEISKLPAGHYAIFKAGQLQFVQYWDLSFPPASHRYAMDESELVSELRRRFIDSVKSQMVSDVPLGSFLSAGLDSSSIVAAMAQVSAEPIRTYTIAFAPKYRLGEVTIDDPAVARRTAEYFGCRHSEIIVEPNIVDLLPKLLWHLDEPIADPAIIMAYLVSREASKDVTVLLSGVGGDELFAGYRKYIAHYIAQQYQHIPAMIRRYAIEPLVQSLPTMRGTRFKGYIRLAKKMARSGSLSSCDRFLMDSTYFTEQCMSTLLADDETCLEHIPRPWSRHLGHFDRVKTADFLNQMLYVDIKTFMVSLNLTYNDKMSMASSIEVRVPFLDWELAEWVALNIPPTLKLRNRTTKYIFRKAMQPLLPTEVLHQKKAGFGGPIDYWLLHDLRDMVGDLLGEPRVRARGYFRPEAIAALLSAHYSGKADWSLQIWALLTFELWHQTFIDRKAP